MLIVYGTRHGATASTSEEIAAMLEEQDGEREIEKSVMIFFSKTDLRRSLKILAWEEIMFEPDEQVENVVFQALAHPMRRTILKIIAYRPEGVSYTDLITELGLSTGKLNYHLEQLEGLVGKNEKRRYVLTPLGKKALNQLNLIKEEVSSEDEKYVRIAEAAHKSSLQPALRSFLLVGIAFSLVFIAGWIYLAYIAIAEGAPVIVYILLPVLIALGVGLLGSLILALKKTPDWIRRLERRLLGPA